MDSSVVKVKYNSYLCYNLLNLYFELNFKWTYICNLPESKRNVAVNYEECLFKSGAYFPKTNNLIINA